ncbi:sugar ABC transporter ATP-binding protein [Arvimicrobium flavum]|uniref:sugar ABC transporter ATP-binding protein n=1 Tax=Arvimicrobium flavum TaxID=3393320 RepID=UPI00237B4A93|nr:sugar ABC transporter ATP-binding protein [Mesorhizobium shangrilense]
MTQPVLEMRDISKNFAMTAALDGLSIALQPGEIHGLVGENGAGKSTLIKIMTGVHQPSSGDISVHGEKRVINGPREAQALGIAAIYQEPMVFPDLDVAENIFISHRDRGQIVNWTKTRADAGALLARLGVNIDVERPASGLTLAEQQAVEIARALSLDVRVLIMDEPTASLSAHETRQLLAIARTLQKQGVAVVYISHRLEEVFEIADSVTVMRDGRHISTRAIGDTSPERLIAEMVGRDVGQFFARVPSSARDEVVLSVEGLGREGVFSDVGFDLRAGEVLCFAGLVGARRTDVALSIFGVEPADTGTIRIGGKIISPRTPQDGMAEGIAYVSEDRRKLGLAMTMPIYANATLPTLQRFLARFGFIRHDQELAMAESYRKRLNIRTPDVETDVGKLSGGNQQKVMLAKWLHMDPKILILDEPTRGIDVGAKAEVHAIIHELARKGVAIIVISSDLPEVLSLADRILVMREGRQMGILDGDTATQESVMTLATGQAPRREAA